MTAQWLLDNLSSFLAAFALLWLGWREAERREQVKAFADLSQRVNGIELSVVRDMPSKEDVEKLGERLDRLDNTLSQVREMVVRLDERGKMHDRE